MRFNDVLSFGLLIILSKGLGSSNSTHFKPAGAPQPAPGLTPVQFYETVMSDDGAAPSFIPPRSFITIDLCSEKFIYVVYNSIPSLSRVRLMV